MSKTERILSFSPYAYWQLHALYEVAICHSLQWRGHDYTYVSCDGLLSDCDMFWEATVGPRPANACTGCQAQVKTFLENCRIPHTPLGKFKASGGVDAARAFVDQLPDSQLLEAVFEGYPVAEWVRSSVHSHLRINVIDLANPKHCAALRSYLYSGVVALGCIKRMLDELQPTILLLFNGRMSVTRIALELARERGIRIVCHERGLARETLLLWENESCMSLAPFERIAREWGHLPLGRREVARVTQWLNDRAQGNNLNWRAFSVQSSLGPVDAFLATHRGKKLLSLFTTSMDEIVSEPEYRSAFVTQARWIEETVAFARLHPEVALVIRVHPNSGGKKSTGSNREEREFFQRLQEGLPANVALVMPDDKVSTYALIDRTDLGLVYGSTVALEMAARGKRVLLASRSPWMQCSSIHLITEPQEYASLLAARVASTSSAAEAEGIALAAHRFAYAYIHRWNIPFPLVSMPDIHHGALTARTLDEFKPGVHDCLDRTTEIVLGLRPSIPVAIAPVRAGAAAEEIAALRFSLKTLAGDPAEPTPPRVSVVITCYNYGKFLRECVRSVANQSFRDLEVIIVNDGSTDDSLTVAEACVKEFAAIRMAVLDQPNSGQPALSRNAGIRQAKGEFILPIDADDRIAADYLEEAFKAIDANPAVDLVYSDSLFDNGKSRSRKHPGRFDIKALSACNQLVYCCVYRRAIWEKVGGYRDNVRGYEDWDFWIAACLAGARAVHIPTVGLLYNEKNSGVYSQTVAHHQTRFAQVMLNNPSAYAPAQLQQAKRILAAATKPRTPALVSVVIPCYNQAQYLGEAVASVIAQSYPHWEIIIVNDGSPDHTSQVAQELILTKPGHKIRLIEKANGGLADARNAGIRFARGSYLLPLDADDMIDPTFLAKTVALLDGNPAIGIAYTDWVYFGAYRAKREAIDYDFKRLCTKENLFTCTSLYRKEAWDATGGYNPNMTRGVEDWEFWIACGAKGFTGQRIPEPLFFYRAKDQSMIHTLQPHLPAMFARIILNHPQLYNPSAVASAQKLFDAANLPPPKPSSSGTEWVPPAKSLPEFLKLIEDASNLVRAQRPAEASALVEQALLLAPNAECTARANEILDMLRSSPAAPQGEPTGPVELFSADERAAIDHVISAYAANPADPALQSQLSELQQGLMNHLVTADPDQLEQQFKGGLGHVYRALIKSGLSAEPPTEGSREQCAILDEALATSAAAGATCDHRLMLARMLRAPAHRGSVTLAPEQLPGWFLEDYLAYVLHAPQVFVVADEVEQYHAHLLAWARAIAQRIRTAPQDRLTMTIAHFFATKANYIPLYFSNRNTCEVTQLRGAILEFVLARNGAAIDARLPKRPKQRAKIKVGFLNAHFGAQTETHVTLPTLQLDREKFEICLFALAANSGPIETYCRSFADTFTLLPAKLPQQVKTIRDAALDVLIIGTNVTAVTNAVSLIALHRLAPLQLVSYCSPVSTGLRHVDGYLTGTFNDVPGVQEHFTEKLHFCEGPPGCLDYTVEAPASARRMDRASLGIAPDELVFVNAAACYKILPEMQDTWARILQAVPGSRLLLLPFNPNWSSAFPVKQFERTLTEACARHGVSRERFILAGSLPSRADVKALESLADVYLDTFPFSGSISVIDPLELGIPTVVWEGQTHRSRMAASLLRELQIPELITQGEEAYLALATRLATDANYRKGLPARIRAAMANQPKFVTPARYAEGLGRLLTSLVTGGKPSSPPPPARAPELAHAG